MTDAKTIDTPPPTPDPAPPPEPAREAPVAAWAPMKFPVFRMLWSAWLLANVSLWMNDVAAAWVMTSMAPSPLWVALVQTASTLPVFLLGIPSGALADIVDRRSYFIVTQVWVAATGVLLCVVSLFDLLNPPLLLALVFLNGIGLAMRWPVFSAIVPSLVPRSHLPAALALNGVSMNASRIVGPLTAGLILASVGSAYVFLLNAALSIVAAGLIFRWRSEPKTSTLPGERFVGAMRVGLQHVRESKPMHAAMWRCGGFFFQTAAALSLLPLIAQRYDASGAGIFTALMASMGAGAIVSALLLPRLRSRMDRAATVKLGVIAHAVATVVLAFAPHEAVALPAMFVIGMAWLTAANALTISAQLALPDWVRARGMAIYQMVLMGSGAIGAAVWGQFATVSDLRSTLLASAAFGLSALLATRHLVLDHPSADASVAMPTFVYPEPSIALQPHDGPIMVTVEYRIDPARAHGFMDVMQRTRASRLRLGVLSWGLFCDTADAGRYVEYFLDESWVEHLRRYDRFSAEDAQLRHERFDYHLGPDAPAVSRFLARSLAG
jgi:MFS family permease